jgi:hypothetical protein
MIAIANCGGITAPFLFPSTTSPMYSMGNWTIFAFLSTAVLMTLYIWYVFGSHGGYKDDDAPQHDDIEAVDATSDDLEPVPDTKGSKLD